MTSPSDAIRDLLKKSLTQDADRIEKLPQSGSDRAYYRIITSSGNTYIATASQHVKENKTFIYFTETFAGTAAPVPRVLAVNETNDIYLQEDLGDMSLLNMLEKEGTSTTVYELFQKSLANLAHLQIQGDKVLDYEQCITSKTFGEQAILADLLYFKYYFLDTLKIPYDKEKLIEEFEALSNYLFHVDHKYFMYRDFQSRNIMVKEEQIFFIDYQGGMKGALQYDVASLLWQAKANLPQEWKQNLLEYYMDCVAHELGKPLNRPAFVSQYNGYVLIRLLQVLGAYGFRGLFERKAHFLSSIPLALQNLRSFLQHHQTGIALPLFESLLKAVVSDKAMEQFAIPRADESTPLLVNINSFSYLQNGYPKDESKNGGGYVFDCRGILNPGRIEEYKKQSGRDKSVKDFLEQETKMPDFLNSVFDIVDISIEDYLKRGFERLEINFGCTGGQHRSVYAAEALQRHLSNKYGVKSRLQHLNQSNWVK